MSTRFAPRQGLIIVYADVYGPLGCIQARFALDTGAVTTTIRTGILEEIGYNLSLPAGQTRIVTGSRIETVPVLVLSQITALGQTKTDMPMLSYTLPAAANIDGVLGLDFLREQTLTIDFRQGLLTLA